MLPSCTSNPKTGDYILYPPTLISELGGVISVDTPFSEQLQTMSSTRSHSKQRTVGRVMLRASLSVETLRLASLHLSEPTVFCTDDSFLLLLAAS